VANTEAGPSGSGKDSTIYDTVAPDASIQATSGGASVQVSWSAIDPAPASGVDYYDPSGKPQG
jgi:hypothetical protein